jgi:negative regulator of sigma E activity
MKEESINKAKEKISAYLDDASSKSELDDLLSMDAGQIEQLGTASRYQMIGDVLRGQLGDASMIDVRLQVSEALQHEDMKQEKVDAAEGERAEIRSNNRSNIGSSIFGSWFNHVGFNQTWYRPVGGLAVAASVAMIMVFTASHDQTAFDKGNLVAERAPGNTMVNTQPVVSMPVSTSTAGVINMQNPADSANPQTYPQVFSQAHPRVNLDAYLAEHAEFAAQDTVQGRMPYARAVSYEAE